MNREILFRGKMIDTGEWVEGSLLHDKTLDYNDVSEFSIWSNEGNGKWCDVDPETVSQFTGMKDKNGDRVFEGDIVNVHVFTQELGENYGVCEGEKQFAGLVEFGVTGLTVKANGFKDQIWFYENFHEESLEVIGNAFDNPDLLTKTDNDDNH